jgi:hypothetical protein
MPATAAIAKTPPLDQPEDVPGVLLEWEPESLFEPELELVAVDDDDDDDDEASTLGVTR